MIGALDYQFLEKWFEKAFGRKAKYDDDYFQNWISRYEKYGLIGMIEFMDEFRRKVFVKELIEIMGGE